MIRKKTRFISIMLSVVMLFGMMGYISIDNTYAASKKIHLKKTTVSLVAGKTYQQKLINKNGKTIKATKVKWKSAKTSVAKIDKKGKIKAAKAGTAKMTAKYKGKTYKFTVKVKKPEAPKVVQVKSVTLDGNVSFDMDKGETRTINATISPSNAASKKIVWSSSDDSVVSVDQSGTVTAVNYGYCDIRATANNGVYAEKRIRVGRIFLDNNTITVGLNDTVTVNVYSQCRFPGTVNYYPSYIDLEWGDHWTDSDSNIMTSELRVTGKKIGSSKVIIHNYLGEDKTIEVTVNVTAPPDQARELLRTYILTNGKEATSSSGIIGDYYIESKPYATSYENRIVISAYLDNDTIVMYSIAEDNTKFILYRNIA